MHLFDLMEVAKAKALLTKLKPDEEFIWRSMERDYSKTFHTPLHLVSGLDPEYILLALYEDQLEQLNLDNERECQTVLDNLYSLDDPEYDSKREAEEVAYNEKIVREDEIRQAKLAAQKNASIKKDEKKTSEPPKELPKGGSINLAYLSENGNKEG